MITVVSNRKLIQESKGLLETLINSCTLNVDRIIIREKDLDVNTIKNLVEKLNPYAKEYNIDIFVNSPYELEEGLGASGRHYTFKQFMELKKKPNYKIGVSVHSVDEIRLLNEFNIEYVLLGHIFETDCKKNTSPRGTEFLVELRKESSNKVIPIGGINLNNYEELEYKSKNDFALMSSVMKCNNPKKYIGKFNF